AASASSDFHRNFFISGVGLSSFTTRNLFTELRSVDSGRSKASILSLPHGWKVAKREVMLRASSEEQVVV
uniref:Uncharacterized protein n=2 Tax=Parascaris univalens TaxID=6257 RepID=A0A915BF34_PARUN